MKGWLWMMLAIVACTAQTAQCWPTVFPTGTTLYDPELAYNGYVLFAPMGDDSHTVRLINMSGEVVHEWQFPFQTIQSRLLSNGNLLVTGFDPTPKAGRPGLVPLWMGGVAGILVEVSWTGQKLFEHRDPNMHHDALKLPDGNYLYLDWERVPLALQARVRGGIRNSEHRDLPIDARVSPEDVLRADKLMFNDVVVEIDPQGKVVGTWEANQHLDPDLDIIGPVQGREEWCHANSLNLLSNGDLLLTSRALDSILVIDRKTGDVKYRWGNMTRLNKQTGEAELIGKFDPDRKNAETLSGPHAAQEIPRGVPGAGHFVVYDNGVVSRGALRSSRGVEIDPATGKVVWQSLKTENGTPLPFGRKHFSDFLGSAQKLPNGNMLLCDGANGRFFQVTTDHQTVWEYVNPFIEDPRFNGSVYKAYCFPPDYCPQFKELPPAKGAAITPASGGEAGRLALRIGSRRIVLSAAEIAGLFCIGAMVTFAVGWRWGQRRAARAIAIESQSNSARKREVRRSK